MINRKKCIEPITQLLFLLSIISCVVCAPFNIVGIDAHTEDYDLESPVTVVCDHTFRNVNNSHVLNMIQIEDVGNLGNYDMSYWYGLAEEHGYRGVIVAVTDHKLLGEAAFFYYKNTTSFDVLKYEILADDYVNICNSSLQGNHTNEMLIEVTVLRNEWTVFYGGFLFIFCWSLVILAAFIVTVLTFFIMFKNWTEIALIFKVIIVLVAVSNIIRIFYAIIFIYSKFAPQVPHIALYLISELIGSFGVFNLSIIFILLYIAFWQIIHNMSFESLDSEAKKYVLVIVIVDGILFIVGIMLFLTADSQSVYYVSYIYFILMYIFTVIYYAVTLVLVSKVLSSMRNLKKESSSEKKKKTAVSRLTNLLKLQLVVLVVIALLITGTFYIVSPYQSSIVVCLQNILLSFFGLTTVYRQRKENTKSRSTKN